LGKSLGKCLGKSLGKCLGKSLGKSLGKCLGWLKWIDGKLVNKVNNWECWLYKLSMQNMTAPQIINKISKIVN